MFYKDDNMAVFIDGQSLHSAAKGLGFDVDYAKLRDEFTRRGKLRNISYYGTYVESDEHQPIRPLCDWLSYNGFNVTLKVLRENMDHAGRRKIKGGISTELIVDVLRAAETCNHIVIFSGDGEIAYLIDELKRRGVYTTIVSTVKTKPAIASDELRRSSNSFIDLDSLRGLISRPEVSRYQIEES